MTKAELQNFIEYVKTHAQSHTFEYFDHIVQLTQKNIFYDMNELIDVMEKYPVTEEAEPATEPDIGDRLREVYRVYRKVGFTDAQAFELTKLYYDNLMRQTYSRK